MVRKKVSGGFFVAEVVVVWWSGVLDSVCALVGTALFNTTMRDWTVTTTHTQALPLQALELTCLSSLYCFENCPPTLLPYRRLKSRFQRDRWLLRF